MKATMTKDSYVIEFEELEVRAIQSAVQWAEMLEEEGKLEIFDYQRETFRKLKRL